MMADVPRSFVEFYDALYGRVLGVLRLSVGDLAVAEELTQETFVRVCRHWERVAEMTSPVAWTYRVAINLATSQHRRRQAERRAQQRAQSSVTNPERLAAHDAELTVALTVRRALADLRPDERTVLVLRFYADLSVAETAGLLGVPEGTVKSRTRRALSRLREQGLTELEEEPIDGR
jgi:RNA polymerase sigma factor (sigma-70 family)